MFSLFFLHISLDRRPGSTLCGRVSRCQSFNESASAKRAMLRCWQLNGCLGSMDVYGYWWPMMATMSTVSTVPIVVAVRLYSSYQVFLIILWPSLIRWYMLVQFLLFVLGLAPRRSSVASSAFVFVSDSRCRQLGTGVTSQDEAQMFYLLLARRRVLHLW